MKQSKSINLRTLGTISAVSLLALTACKDETTVADGQFIFESVQECTQAGVRDCDARWSAALGNHVSSGPRYASDQACSDRGHEACMSVNSGAGGQVWLPAMVGFLAGKAVSQSRPVYLQAYPDRDRLPQDRQVVAGSNGGGTVPVFVGNWFYPYGSGGYSSGSLGSGMNLGAQRASNNFATGAAPASRPAAQTARVNTNVAQAAQTAAAARSAAPATSVARGGFGATGAGVSAGT